MQTFKDKDGRDWTVGVNVDAVKRVKARLSVDLLDIGNGDANLLVRLADDPVLLVDVLFALCEPDAKQAGVTDEMFGRAMAGEAIDAATDALMQELSDFFPKGRRTLLKAGLAKLGKTMDLATKRGVERIEAWDVEKSIAAAEASGLASTSSPATSASPPAP